MNAMETMDSDMLIDWARLILKVQYRQRIRELQGRLDSFEAVNWEGIKSQLRQHENLVRVVHEGDTAEQWCEIRAQEVVAWVEEVLSV